MSDTQIGRNINTHDEAYITDPIPLSDLESTEILPANPDRIAVQINNNSSTQAAWIKLQDASVDDDKKGIFLHKKGDPHGEWNMPTDNIYTGPICGIAAVGSPTVYATEY